MLDCGKRIKNMLENVIKKHAVEKIHRQIKVGRKAAMEHAIEPACCLGKGSLEGLNTPYLDIAFLF